MQIAKTLAYASNTYGTTAVYVSDLTFKSTSNSLAAQLPSGWSVQNIHLEDMPVSTAQAQLLAAMDNSAALINYNGHSSPTSWTNSGLFDASMVSTLTNFDKPFVVVQWSCYSAYAIDPRTKGLVEGFLFSGNQGAAAVLGSPTLSGTYPEQVFGLFMTPLMVQPGLPIGKAMLEAKGNFAQYATNMSMNQSDRLEILLAWTMMGDPALIINH